MQENSDNPLFPSKVVTVEVIAIIVYLVIPEPYFCLSCVLPTRISAYSKQVGYRSFPQTTDTILTGIIYEFF